MFGEQSGPSKMRLLCSQIEKQVDEVINRFHQKFEKTSGQNRGEGSRSPIEMIKNQYERSLQELKNNLVQIISNLLPTVIEIEQKMQQRLEDAEEEREQWNQKYKKIFALYESNQLENDKLKIQVISLSENYENIVMAFEELKFKYHQLRETQQSKTQGLCLQKLKQINYDPSSRSNSESYSERQNIKNENQVMVEERELFLEEIKQSQRDILEFKTKMNSLLQEKERIEKETQELVHLLQGEKNRSDTLDKEIMQLLDINEELKLNALEQKEGEETLKKQIENLEQNIIKMTTQLEQQQINKSQLEESIRDLKRQITQLKGQTSQERQKNLTLEQVQREMKGKITEQNKQNQSLRNQVEKLLIKLSETTHNLENKMRQEVQKLKKQLSEETTKRVAVEQQSSKKNQGKIQQISKMHRQITGKLEQKIRLLEKDLKQKKDKISQMKYQIQRLYESLQVQVEKQFKTAQKVKELTESNMLLERNNKKMEEQLNDIEESGEGRENTLNEMKYQLRSKDKKLKKMSELQTKLTKIVLPKLKQQLHSVQVTCVHFSKMIQLQKEQTSFFLQSRNQHFGQLLSQSILAKQLDSEKVEMTYQGQLSKWKEMCKNYQQKYSKLKENYEYLNEKVTNIESEKTKMEEQKEERINDLEDKLDKQQLQHLGTLKTVDKLKDKCREVEQYYKLVQQLQRENMKLKQKLNSLELYSFRGETQPFNTTKPRQKFIQDPLMRYTKTGNPDAFHSKTNINDITAKAEYQKLRLQAVKREYDMVNQGQY